jgi:hypothetical protein
VEGIRFARAGLLIGWFLVSMLVVAGFAAFSADEGSAGGGQTPSAVAAGDVGRTAGAVSALSFAGTTRSTSPASADHADLLAWIADDWDSPTTTAAPRSDMRSGVFVRSRYLEETEVRRLVAAHFRPDDVNRAIRVAWCASAFNPSAVNPATGASGLFQHLPDHWAEYSNAAGRPGSSMFDPEANVLVAAWMLYDLPGGWSHWKCNP